MSFNFKKLVLSFFMILISSQAFAVIDPNKDILDEGMQKIIPYSKTEITVALILIAAVIFFIYRKVKNWQSKW